jgi:glycosyltransferase involved in cell wall biosynthesis
MSRWPDHELRRVADIIREHKVDVVHTHMSKANFFGVLLRWYAGVPSVATAHSCHLQLHWIANNFVIAVSEATRRYHRFVNLVPSSRITTIHNSIRIPADQTCEQRNARKLAVRAELHLSATAFVMGIVGRISEQKGQLLMVEAMPSVIERVPNAQLVLIGGLETPSYLEEIQRKIAEYGIQDRVHVLGLRYDVLELLYGMDLLVQPSLWESFPISMLEGMAAGVPIVATDVGGVKECIEHNRSGCLVASKDSNALGNAIAEMAHDPGRCERYANEAKKVVDFRFSPAMQCVKLEAVLSSVCKPKSQRVAA